MAFGGVFNGKRVLVTGHAGFKGSWLSLWLNALGAKVCGYSLLPDTEFSAYREAGVGEILECEKIADIRDSEELESFFRKARPEIVFHLAAQPLVRLSYSEPKLTYETNVLGTLNVFEAARKCGSVAALVNVTTDKCYENPETGRPCAEDDPMGGYDMYSSSKACSEILTSSY
ncbi:MAG: GDP-mannose 4,6-dehydratase, partial [Opitutales bacterium]|nr:GDP-mannose 4,6-dehydratase [Opitutales bacterium]